MKIPKVVYSDVDGASGKGKHLKFYWWWLNMNTVCKDIFWYLFMIVIESK